MDAGRAPEVYRAAMGERPALFLGLLADQPELIAEVGVLRWRASGSIGTPGPWIDASARDAGRDELPLTLVAMDLDGRAIGAITLGLAEESLAAGCPARSPCVVGLVVRRGERLCGVGRLMVSAVEDLARQRGRGRLWVSASGDEAEFYRHCGWQDGDAAPTAGGAVLIKTLLPV
jgi:GNAT superfamily N-acetyltransferase